MWKGEFNLKLNLKSESDLFTEIRMYKTNLKILQTVTSYISRANSINTNSHHWCIKIKLGSGIKYTIKWQVSNQIILLFALSNLGHTLTYYLNAAAQKFKLECLLQIKNHHNLNIFLNICPIKI